MTKPNILLIVADQLSQQAVGGRGVLANLDRLAERGARFMECYTPCPLCRPVLAEHRRLLDQHLAVTADPFATLAPKVDARWRSHAPGYHLHRGPAAPMKAAEEKEISVAKF